MTTGRQKRKDREAATGVRAQVARLILDRGSVSKADIGEQLGLSRPTVINAIASLIEEGAVEESGEYASTGGRRAKAISAAPAYGYFGGIDITANHVAFVVVDWAGGVVSKVRKRIAFENSQTYFDSLAREFSSFVRKLGLGPEKLKCVGVSVPGILSDDHRTLVRSHALRVEYLDLSAISSRLRRYRVDFENDANAAEIAERPSLRGNSVFLSLSNTVGGSFALDRTMYLGDNRRAGEFGHMILHPNGSRCYCGKRGCADSYLSALRLAEKASSLEDFFARLESVEERIRKVWSCYLDDLAIMVSNLRMAYDSEVVVGGYVGALMEPHLVELRKKVASLDLFEGDAEWIRVARCGRESSAIGAALILRNAVAMAL